MTNSTSSRTPTRRMLLPSSPRHASLLQVPEHLRDLFETDDDGVSLAEDEDGTGTYSPSYVYSYEHESYEFSYSFELEDLDSYSYEFVDSMSEEEESYSYHFSEETRMPPPPPPGAVQSVTSMDVSLLYTILCFGLEITLRWYIGLFTAFSRTSLIPRR